MAFWNERKPFGRKVVADPAPPAAVPTDVRQYGKAMCALTYRGQPSRAALFGPLLTDTLQDILDGDPTGTLASGTAMLPTRWGMVVGMFVEAPMPLPDPPDSPAQRACWDGWRDSAASWGSHAIIAAFSQPGTLEEARTAAHAVLQVSAVLASTTPAQGVNWMNTPLFHPAAAFTELCRHRPVPVEVAVQPCFYRGGTDAEVRVGACTRGLRLFGLPEVDLQPGTLPMGEVYSRVMNIAAYLLDGAVFSDGDTLGTGTAAQSRVHYAPDPEGGRRLTVVDER